MNILTIRKSGQCIFHFLLVFLMTRPLFAAGHGPVYGLATPTLGKRAWSLDLAIMSRYSTGATGSMLRSMLRHGITEDLQISFSIPVILRNVTLSPARLTGMMPANRNFEGLAAWRFARQGVKVGARRESTAYLGITVPKKSRLGNLQTAPGFYAALATGYASRSHYFWIGAGYTRYLERDGDRLGDLLFYSLVWGYRPPALQKDYPKPDWRLFVELVGERLGRNQQADKTLPQTGGDQIFLGPTALAIFRNLAAAWPEIFLDNEIFFRNFYYYKA